MPSWYSSCDTGFPALAYIWRVPALIASDMGPARGRHTRSTTALASSAGRAARWALLACALAAGLVIAAATVHLAAGWATVAAGG